MRENRYWNRCGVCGRFISVADFTDGRAYRRDTSPYNPYAMEPTDPEDYTSFHKECLPEE